MSVISPKSSGLVTIRYIVMSILNRLSDYSMKSYVRLVQICIEGFSELSLWHLHGLEVVYLHMNTAKVVALPSDYIDYVKIGIPINGRLQVISRKDNVLLPRLFDTGGAVGNTDDGIGVDGSVDDDTISNAIYFAGHWRNGQYIGALFGVAGGIDDAYYRIDLENRQIVFSGSTPRAEIVMEYISSGLKTDGSSLIPREAIPALRTYVLWQADENNPRIAYNAKERLKREHEEAVAALRSFQQSFTKDEYLQMVYGSYYQAPKR
jgi:hypothetical protein